MKNTNFNHPLGICLVLVTCTLLCCSPPEQEKVAQANIDGIMFAILRNLDKNVATTDEAHGYAIMDFNPFSENFGDTIQTIYRQLGHHGYISPINGSLYVTLSNDLAARVNITIEANAYLKLRE